MSFRTASQHVLVLAGSAEARELSSLLTQAEAAHRVVLTAPERVPRSWPVPLRALGGVKDLEAELAVPGLSAVIDARHPCDGADDWSAALRHSPVPNLRLRRPPWRAGPGDRWITLRTEAEVAQVIRRGARLLIGVGRDRLSGLHGLKECRLYIRQLDRHVAPCPLANGTWLWGNAPFTVDQEIALMRKLRIDAVVVRNAGGAGGWPKLAAARRLRRPVLMIDRPRPGGGPEVQSAQEAMTWLKTR